MTEIPRKIAFFWTGRMSWLRWLTLSTFRQHNPDWHIQLYMPEEPCAAKTWETPEDSDSHHGPDYWDRLEGMNIDERIWDVPVDGLAPAQACDLWEWWLLGREGGFVADMDILWLKPLDPLRERLGASDAVFCLESGWMGIGFLGTANGCPLFRQAYEMGVAEYGTSYQHFGTELLYRLAGMGSQPSPPSPGHDAVREFMRRFPELQMAVVPDETVYPFDWREIDVIFERDVLVPDSTIGMHWFGGSHQAQKWSKLLTEEGWGGYENTLTRCLREVL